MILIADSGSTKCSWAICDLKGNIVDRCSTIGFNPYFITSKKVLNHLDESALNEIRHQITKVFFYGAGCSSKKMNATTFSIVIFERKFLAVEIGFSFILMNIL